MINQQRRQKHLRTGTPHILLRSMLTALLLSVASMMLATESAAQDCGGDGQRGCCFASTERLLTGACDENLVEEPGCTGTCACQEFGLATLFNFSSSGTCRVPSDCGGDGERACCITGETRWGDNPIPASGGCDGTPTGGTANLTELAGGAPSPAVCGGYNPFSAKSNGVCVPCGSEGAHACVGGDTTPATECLPGLSKDAFGYCGACGGDGQQLCVDQMCHAGYHPDFGVCVADRTIAEPDCNCTEDPLPTPNPAQPVVGYADLHLHMFSNLAFGGMVLWGDAYDPTLGISGALRADNFVQRNADYQINGHALSGINDATLAPDLLRGATLMHGDGHVNDLINFGQGIHRLQANGGVEWDPNCLSCGSPIEDFSGWPHWGSVTHQQAYFTWLQRAHRGGMQLTVMLAVTNESMCAAGRHLDYPELDCEDTMAGIKLQIGKAREFEHWNDQQCTAGYALSQDPDPGISAAGDVLVDRHCAQGGGPSGTGWYRIAEDPAAARAAIANGQLAVVLGIEESALFGYKVGVTDQFDDVERQLQEFLSLGVRHVFPIHNFDNAFGGTATWNETIAVGHRYANRHSNDWMTTESCPNTPSQDGSDSYGYKLYGDPVLNGFVGALTFGIDATSYPNTNDIEGWSDFDGTCNTKGLTAFGEGLVERLIDVGMIIDIDHMSNHSFNRTLEIAESHNYPGIVASHALMYDLHKEGARHERMRTKPQLERIAALGGMIGVMTQPPDGDGKVMIEDAARANLASTNDCEASSKSFSAAYEWAVKVMEPGFPVGKTFGIAFGTDFNGISKHNAPRFGLEACANAPEAATQDVATEVVYPFTIPGFGTFDQQQTSNRVFDFNTDGLAHIGLLPDMVEDIGNSYLTGANDLDPLFNSAEAYLQMWEGAEAVADTITVPPVTSDEIAPTSRATVAGASLERFAWFTSATIVDIDGSDEAGGSGLAGFDLRSSENTTRPLDNSGTNWPAYTDTSVSSATTSNSYNTEGKWRFGLRARDLAGNEENYRYYQIGVDWTPPTLTALISPADNGSGWHNVPPIVSFTCFDTLVGDNMSCPADVDLSGASDGIFDLTNRVATDPAGNVSAPSDAIIRLDREAPHVEVTIGSAFPGFGGWYRSDVYLSYVCSDPHDRSGVASCPSNASFTAETALQPIIVQTADNAGNLFDGHPQVAGTQQNLYYGIGIDKTPPTLTFVAVAGPGPGQATVTPTCADTLSGLSQFTNCDPRVVSLSGTDPTVTLVAGDQAGNITEVEVHLFDEIADTELPTIYASNFSPNWSNSDAEIRFFCDDDRAVTSCGPDQTVSAEGANQTVQGVAIDEAGNQSAPLVVGPLNIDKTPPTLTIASVTPRPDLLYSNYEITFVCSDALSGVSSCSGPRLVNSYNAPSITVSAQDQVANRTDLVVSWAAVHAPDTTPPTIVASLVPPANAAGWVNASSVVHFECADAQSGISSCSFDRTIYVSEVGQTRQGQTIDQAGNGPVVTSITYNADVTLPAIAVATMTAGPGPNEVTATFTCSDAHSGIDTCEGPMVLDTSPTPEVGVATATDIAGNVATIEVSSEGADLVPPTIDHVIFRLTPNNIEEIISNPPNWFTNTPRWVRWICADDLPGVTCSPDLAIHALPDGVSQLLTGEAVDAAGNRVTKTITVNKDGSAPDASITQTPAFRGVGGGVWYNADVVYDFTCADPHSGIDFCNEPTVAAGEGFGIEMPVGSVSNNAGWTLQADEIPGFRNYTVNIDKTAPTIALELVSYSTAPNLKIDVICTDPLPPGVNSRSGVADCIGFSSQLATRFIDASTGATTYQATVTDQAGNESSITIDYSDKVYNATPPVVSVIATPLPNAAGWNNTDVDLNVTCIDPENQMAQFACTQDTGVGEGANQYLNASGSDYWGNYADINFGPINVDKTLPEISPSEGPGPNAWEVSVSFACYDWPSGLASCDAPIDLALGYGDITVSGTAVDVAGNSTTVEYVVDGCQRSCDADCNGYVDGRDVLEIAAAEGEIAEPGDVLDIDLDGWITSSDTMLCTNECDEMNCEEAGGPPYIVPEPGSVLSLGAGLLALTGLARARRRRLVRLSIIHATPCHAI